MLGNDHHIDEVLRHSRTIKDETGALVGELHGVAREIGRAMDVQGHMERHPWATMSAAVGLGYVLGGGLFTRFTGRLLHAGARVLLVPLLRGQWNAMAFGESESSGGRGYAGAGTEHSQKRT